MHYLEHHVHTDRHTHTHTLMFETCLSVPPDAAPILLKQASEEHRGIAKKQFVFCIAKSCEDKLCFPLRVFIWFLSMGGKGADSIRGLVWWSSAHVPRMCPRIACPLARRNQKYACARGLPFEGLGFWYTASRTGCRQQKWDLGCLGC